MGKQELKNHIKLSRVIVQNISKFHVSVVIDQPDMMSMILTKERFTKVQKLNMSILVIKKKQNELLKIISQKWDMGITPNLKNLKISY